MAVLLVSDTSVLIDSHRGGLLSVPDAFALALAKIGGHVLLAGDRNLRDLATAEQVTCHGVLWVLDALETGALLHPRGLLAALQAISSHPRCRLPEAEIQRRIDRYRRAASRQR